MTQPHLIDPKNEFKHFTSIEKSQKMFKFVISAVVAVAAVTGKKKKFNRKYHRFKELISNI